MAGRSASESLPSYGYKRLRSGSLAIVTCFHLSLSINDWRRPRQTLAPGFIEEGGRRTKDFLRRINLRPFAAVQLFAVLLVVGSAVGCTRLGTPEGWSGGQISGDVLYIGTMEGDLRAIDIESGGTICTFQLESEAPDRAFYGSPALSEDMLFVGGYDGNLYALSLDCDRLWEPIDQEIVGSGEPIVGGTVVADDVLLVGSSDGHLYAFEIERGDTGVRLGEKWKYPTGNRVWSTPAVADGVVYFGSLDHNLYAVRLSDGEPVWPEPFTAQGAITAKPVVSRGRVYFGAFDSVFYAIDAQTGREEWRFEQATNWFWGGAVIRDDTIYAPSLDGNLYGLDVDTGALNWKLETGGAILGSPSIAGERIAVASQHSKRASLHIASLLDGGDEKRCTFGNKNSTKIRASLAFHENVVYLAATDHSIRALEIDSRGDPDEKWVHFTNEDISVDLSREADC